MELAVTGMLRAMILRAVLRSRGAKRPGHGSTLAQKEEGAGDPQERGRREDRVRAAPVVSCANAHSKNAHEHTGSAEAVRPSLRNGFNGLCRALPGDEFVFVTVIVGLTFCRIR